jgi:demethylmenaquinone methyltransferase/2-methoxy-6-polyprenyl-1,4-benzoquinol methylase
MVEKNQNNVDFGYMSVKKTDRQKLVNKVFNSVADKYDIMNDITSLGIHRRWKNDLINWLAPQSTQNLADIAGGTGDIANKFLIAGGNSAHVFDINKEMIQIGKQKYKNINMDWTIASAENIPVLDNSFERATMSFGLRNITDRNKSLQEIFRILKPGGRFICLEFSHVENELFKKFYDLWSLKIIPFIGQKITGDKEAYTYLVESIRKFPTQAEVSHMLSQVGFSRVRYRNLSNGIVTLHSGWKL